MICNSIDKKENKEGKRHTQTQTKPPRIFRKNLWGWIQPNGWEWAINFFFLLWRAPRPVLFMFLRDTVPHQEDEVSLFNVCMLTWVISIKSGYNVRIQCESFTDHDHNRRGKQVHLGGAERNIHCGAAICAASMNINKVLSDLNCNWKRWAEACRWS